MASLDTPSDAEEVRPSFPEGGQDLDPAALKALRETMTAHAGVRRTGAGLKQALAAIARLEGEQSADENFLNMCATATLIAAAALRREESRGGHFRDDFPEADTAQAHRTRITLDEALAIRAEVQKELT